MAQSRKTTFYPSPCHGLQSQLQDMETRLQDNLSRLNVVNEELEQATAALWDQSARLRTILNTIPVGVVVLRQDGRIEGINRAAERMFGISDNLMIGKTLAHHMAFGTMSLADAVRRAAVEQVEATLTHAQGAVYDLLVAAKRLPGVEHDSTVLILHDQSDAKREAQRRAELERELAQAQKLESLGTLAGGIAHEINTPIQYVGDNIRFMNDSFAQLHSLFQQIQALSAAALEHPQLHDLAAPIAAAIEAGDFEFLLSEIPQAASEAAEGVRRVSEIVRAIKEFSHPGQVDHTLIDLNHAVETTLIIARNQWKYLAELTLDLDADLPQVPCHPGEINQVLLNLIVNAADALSDVCSEDDRGQITIRSRTCGDMVEVRI